MAISQKSIRNPSRQKAHALRMLLTSGVIRSAEVDPPCMEHVRAQTNPSRTLSPSKSVYAKLIHATDHKRHSGLFAQWHTTIVDILKEFGIR